MGEGQAPPPTQNTQRASPRLRIDPIFSRNTQPGSSLHFFYPTQHYVFGNTSPGTGITLGRVSNGTINSAIMFSCSGNDIVFRAKNNTYHGVCIKKAADQVICADTQNDKHLERWEAN